jgi:predicted ester cyclase
VCGLENFKKAVSEFHMNNPDLEVAIEDMIAEQDRVAARYTLRSASACSDGKRAVRTAVSIYRIENGKLAEEWLLDEEFRWS